ncbi:MAG: diguanylate cyclase [Spirochaetales bacterium]
MSNMNSSSERLEIRMAELSRRFTRDVPVRLEQIERSVNAYYDDRTNDSLDSAILHAHKLAGSAGSFGYYVLANLARELELCLGRVRNGSESSEHDSADEGINDLLRRVKEQGLMTASNGSGTNQVDSIGRFPVESDSSPEADSSLGTNAQSGETGEPAIGLLTGRNRPDAAWQELESQLGYFGLSVTRISTREELRALLESARVLVVIAHVETLNDFAEGGFDFNALSDSGGAYASVIAVSEDDSFETRLQAVRNGAAAFFTLPVDMPRLIDKVAEAEEEANPSPLHVLIVDDDVDQVSNLAYLLQRAGMVTSVASDPTQVFSLMVETKPEVVITDMYMPRCNGIELAKLIRQQESFVGIPIIFLSVERDIGQHLEAMSYGGDDFLVKPVNPDHLVSAVRARARRQRQMRYFMERDSLTGMLNHSHLKQQLEREVQRAGRINRPLCYCMIDLDNFKHVNDSYGHLAGDRVLKSISRLLHERLRKTDTIGRHGGEEFGVILFDTDDGQAAKIMDELRESFSRIVHRVGETEFQLTFSCGISAYPRVSDLLQLTELADRGLYQAKQTGKNRVVVV